MPGLSQNAPRPDETQTQWVVGGVSAAVPGTTVLYLGVAHEAGFVLRKITVLPSTSMGVSTAAYHTFRPFIVTTAEGVSTLRYVGTSRGTNQYNLVANVALRVHDEEFLNLPLVKGTQVGVEILTTTTPPAIRVSFQAGLVRHGR